MRYFIAAVLLLVTVLAVAAAFKSEPARRFQVPDPEGPEKQLPPRQLSE